MPDYLNISKFGSVAQKMWAVKVAKKRDIFGPCSNCEREIRQNRGWRRLWTWITIDPPGQTSNNLHIPTDFVFDCMHLPHFWSFDTFWLSCEHPRSIEATEFGLENRWREVFNRVFPTFFKELSVSPYKVRILVFRKFWFEFSSFFQLFGFFFFEVISFNFAWFLDF